MLLPIFPAVKKDIAMGGRPANVSENGNRETCALLPLFFSTHLVLELKHSPSSRLSSVIRRCTGMS